MICDVDGQEYMPGLKTRDGDEMRVYVSEGRITVHYWKGDNHLTPITEVETWFNDPRVYADEV